MRTLVLFFLFLVSIAGCNQKDANTKNTERVALQSDSLQFTTIEWREQSKDFGKISEGQKLEVTYHFKNTGRKPLVIDNVVPACGCTVAETPKEPIAPGKEGEITGVFDSNGRIGLQHKTIAVTANTKGTQTHQLVFTAEVYKKN